MTFADFLSKQPEPRKKNLRYLFAGFSDSAQVNLLSLPAGESVVRQGDRRSDIYVLLSGRVINVSQQARYSSYAFYEYTPIELFGEQEALANLPTILADVRTKTKCRFLIIKESDYMRWVKGDTAILLRRTRTVLNTLLVQASFGRESLFLDSDERLALFLAEYYDNHQKAVGENGVLVVRQGRGAIAEAIGFSARTVNRGVQKLHQNGTVGLHKGKITLDAAQRGLLANSFPQNSGPRPQKLGQGPVTLP